MGPNVVVSPPLVASFAPTIAASAHAAGDCLGNKFQLAAPCPVSSGSPGPVGIVQTVTLTDVDHLDGRIALMVYHTDFTDAGDDNAFAPGAGAEANYVGMAVVEPTDWLTLGNVGYATVSAFGMAAKVIGGVWYAQLVAVDAITTVTPNGIKGAVSGIIT